MQKKNEEVADSLESELRNQCRTEIKKELDKVLQDAVEQGLRDLPFEMVCAYQDDWRASNSIVAYDRITVEFNNNNRPGGADGLMSIETGIFTAVTSGYYIVTFSGYLHVLGGEYTRIELFHNGVQVEESRFETSVGMGSGDNFIHDQGSRTVVGINYVLN